jgi:uncharacterized paraquat-inducible protein A
MVQISYDEEFDDCEHSGELVAIDKKGKAHCRRCGRVWEPSNEELKQITHERNLYDSTSDDY